MPEQLKIYRFTKIATEKNFLLPITNAAQLNMILFAPKTNKRAYNRLMKHLDDNDEFAVIGDEAAASELMIMMAWHMDKANDMPPDILDRIESIDNFVIDTCLVGLWVAELPKTQENV